MPGTQGYGSPTSIFLLFSVIMLFHNDLYIHGWSFLIRKGRQNPKYIEVNNARLVIVQGAPDNQLVNLLNDVYAPLSAENSRIDHQGFLLHTAARIFSEHGVGKIETFRVNAFCAFPEEDITERCQKAAEVLVGFWFKEDPNYEQMKTALIPHLKLHFKHRPHAIGDEVAILSARPFSN